MGSASGFAFLKKDLFAPEMPEATIEDWNLAKAERQKLDRKLSGVE